LSPSGWQNTAILRASDGLDPFDTPTWLVKAQHGSSGGPVYVDGGDGPIIVGVVSGFSGEFDEVIAAPRLSSGLWGDFIPEALGLFRRPIDWPSLLDYDRWFTTSDSSVSTTRIVDEERFTIKAKIFNGGTATAHNVPVHFALSSDGVFGDDEIDLCDVTIPSIAPFQSCMLEVETFVP